MSRPLARLTITGLLGLAACASADRPLPSAPSANAAITAGPLTPIQIYGAWHCGNDACTWATVRTVAEFDQKNHWLIDRGDGRPSVNLVVLSFVQPMTLLNAPETNPLSGLQPGMTKDIVDYFTSHNVRVMLSIGGITYVNAWNQALASDPAKMARNAAAVAKALGVGIEIDYEESSNPNLAGLQTFISTYRNILPYDASGNNPAARLTLDLAAGDRWLIALTRKATADWLNTTTPVLDYANAMVPNKQPTATDAQSNWQEHIDGKPRYGPPILPLAPAKFTGGLYIVTGTKVAPECNNFAKSLQNSTATFVQTVVPKGAGATPGMLGYMFWAAETPSGRRVSTTPPNTCEGGVGAGATAYGVPVPMPALRQQ